MTTIISDPTTSESDSDPDRPASPPTQPGPLASPLIAPATQPPKPPRMPKRMPRSMMPVAPLSIPQVIARSSLALVAAVFFAFAFNLMVLSHLQHVVAQQQLMDTYREQLSAGTAPVSEGAFDDTLLVGGAPVGIIEIPSIGVSQVIVEGTSGGELKSGPGHRRDTVLPGQAGVSVIMGRAAAYGGPFGRIQELAPGETFSVLTGQGLQQYEVIGVRYAGDPSPPSPIAGESRLILETARGPAFIPSGVARVDAQLVSEVQPAGARQSTYNLLPPQATELATDTTTVWALVFALQFFVIAEIAAVWSYRRIGAQKTWVVFVPVMVLSGLVVADQITRLLPNLL
ncbi:sortase [Herbiconiux liukaitaii]|uniref:sortase n=1 Tax=Herbiconiux liukaitaii TaxID=3342799 RepID=UPI0035BB9442